MSIQPANIVQANQEISDLGPARFKAYKQIILVILPVLLLGLLIPQRTAQASEDIPDSTAHDHGQTGIGAPDASEPLITIWYGSNQNFGMLGLPQRQINILGNVSDPDGISFLGYSVNNRPESALSIGAGNIAEDRRLSRVGDFNVEIFDSDLQNGSNQVAIRAEDKLGNQKTVTVTVNYNRGNYWPLPYSTNWNNNQPLLDQAQVVDGKWEIGANGIGPLEIGYDRLLAIGDLSWRDYEVKVPITIHSIDEVGYNDISTNPGVGLVVRWTGHTDEPISGWQPKSGWYPLGAIFWYSYFEDGERLQIYGNQFKNIAMDTSGRKLSFNVPYYFKVRVESVAGQGARYSMKVWQVGTQEPGGWDLSGQGSLSDPKGGSILLLAHHASATFGNVEVTPLEGPPAPSSIVSDDFCQCAFDAGLWQFTDPQGDASFAISGGLSPDAHLTISVPAGTEHAPTTSALNVPRVMQAANDTDFQISAKFESGLSKAYQLQGIAIEQDPGIFLRFEYYDEGTYSRLISAGHSGGTQTIFEDARITTKNVSPLYLGVQRKGNRWTTWSSLNGTDWTPVANFYSEVTVSKVGVYAGNASGSDSPAHTARIDYFFNIGASIANEDAARNALTIINEGSGTVSRNPDKGNYACGEQVTLTPTSDPGWRFTGWGGDLSGSTNPAVITMNGSKEITAIFSHYSIYVPIIVQRYPLD